MNNGLRSCNVVSGGVSFVVFCGGDAEVLDLDDFCCLLGILNFFRIRSSNAACAAAKVTLSDSNSDVVVLFDTDDGGCSLFDTDDDGG